MIKRANVPCAGCTACCEHDLIFLHPELGDRASDYHTMEAENPITGRQGVALQHRPDGACIYLVDGVGCSIHERAPAICREFDCRRFYLSMPRPDRRRLLRDGIVSKAVLDAGRDRAHTLESAT